MASPSAGAPVLKYGDVNTETTSPGEVKGLITFIYPDTKEPFFENFEKYFSINIKIFSSLQKKLADNPYINYYSLIH